MYNISIFVYFLYPLLFSLFPPVLRRLTLDVSRAFVYMFLLSVYVFLYAYIYMSIRTRALAITNGRRSKKNENRGSIFEGHRFTLHSNGACFVSPRKTLDLSVCLSLQAFHKPISPAPSDILFSIRPSESLYTNDHPPFFDTFPSICLSLSLLSLSLALPLLSLSCPSLFSRSTFFFLFRGNTFLDHHKFITINICLLKTSLATRTPPALGQACVAFFPSTAT